MVGGKKLIYLCLFLVLSSFVSAIESNFTTHTITTSEIKYLSVFAIDLDKDEDIDVLSASYQDNEIAWYENNGSESFTKHTITTSTIRAQSVFAIDVDNDEDIDVLSASSWDDKIAWYENNGTGGFTTRTITTSADGATSVFAIDLDKDGDIDVLSASWNSDQIAWYENNGSESFTTHTITTSADAATSVFAIDLDKDGDIDVLSASWNGNELAWYENDGSESFTTHIITTSIDGAESVFAIDLDKDGDIDVLSAIYYDNEIAWYENNGSESFTSHTITTSADGATSVFATDLDKDGDIDVLSTSSAYEEEIKWYENNGSESFTTHAITLIEGAESVFAIDVDSDEDIDVLSAGYYEITWFENMMKQQNCSDGIKNQDETDIDCGGSCPYCENGESCLVDSDCESNACSGGICRLADCDDGRQNGIEEGIDCGWACNNPCNNCEPIINNGDSENKIDVAFIGSGFDNYSQLKQVIEEMVDYDSIGYGLMSVAPFNTSKEKFNFWMIKSLENFTLDNFKKKTKSIGKEFCPFADQVILLSVEPRFRSFANANSFFGLGGKNAFITLGCEFLGRCNYPLDVADTSDGEKPEDCEGDSGWLSCYITKKCSCMGNNDNEVIRTFVHEFGHSFGGLDDEYKSRKGPSFLNPPNELPNCDGFGCSKWSNISGTDCYEECGYFDWYRAYENTIMRFSWELEDDFKQVNINELQKDITKIAPLMVPLTMGELIYEELNLSYLLNLNYSYGNLSLIDSKLVSGKASDKDDQGDYLFKTLSFENVTLDIFNYTFEMQEKLSPPMDWFDNVTGNQTYVPNVTSEFLNETIEVLTLRHFSNAELINIYKNESLLLSINVSEYHDLDNDKIIAVVDNCPYDYNPAQEDSDNDGIGDVCDLISINISLNQGWNLISTPLDLQDKNINSIFTNLNITIFSYNNSWFTPTKIENKLGYWLKTNESKNLTLIGTEIENKTTELNQGWNLIGYQYLNETDINNSNLKNYTIFNYMNTSWLSYNPNRINSLNTLQKLMPGYGYWLNVP